MNEWLTLIGGCALVSLAWARHRARPVELRDELSRLIASQPVAPVTDAGVAPIFAVARALELDPADLLARTGSPARARTDRDEAATLLRPLGLEIVDLIPAETSDGHLLPGRTRMTGIRHGRRVTIELDERSSAVHVAACCATFQARASARRWSGLDRTPRIVADWLGALIPTARWEGVHVSGGRDGLWLWRPDESSSSWMHDLWLAEQLADAAVCAASKAPAPVASRDAEGAYRPAALAQTA